MGLTMREVCELDPEGVTYTFVEGGPSGTPTHIAVKVLLDAVRGRMDTTYCLLGGMVPALERGDLGVEEAHALKFPEAALEVPGIVGEWGNDHVMIDGAHRVWRRWKRGDAGFHAYVVPESVWRHFVVLDVPGDAAFWDDFNRNAVIRTPEMERLLKLLGVK
jgi:hypothetical protein